MEFVHGFPAALGGVLMGRLIDVILKELGKIKNAEKKVNDLEVTVFDVKNRLTELNQYRHHHLLQSRAETLIDLCYDADDLIDSVAIDTVKPSSAIKSWVNKKLTTKPRKIDKLNKQLNLLKKHLEILLKNAEQNGKSVCQGWQPPPGWEIYSPPKYLVGRDNVVTKIYEELVSRSCDMGVSIVGTYGVGKTALAESILSDPRIANEFPLRKQILVPDGVFNYQTVSAELFGYLQRNEPKKLLIMFDNLLFINEKNHWNQLWGTIKRLNGTADVKMLITTVKNSSVPQFTGTKAYELEPLKNQECNELIRVSALQEKHDLCQKSLKTIAESLQEKCGGLPIVAKTIGSVLGSRGEKEWGFLSQKDFWELEDFQARVVPNLPLSCLYMRSDLKMCFTYFSLFPPDYQFKVDYLVHLWVAEGFLPPLNGSSSLQDTTRKCSNDLQQTSVLEYSDGGKIEYKVPVLIHRFAQFSASGTFLLWDDNEAGQSNSTAKARHLSLLRAEADSSIWSNKNLRNRKLRTILSLHKDNEPAGQKVKVPNEPNKLIKFLLKATNIRVLALNGTNVVDLPENINKLVHLRHIDVSNTDMKKLPEKLCELFSLQFINLKGTKVKCFPERFHDLVNLIFLYWDTNGVDPPSNIGKLENLQILPFFYLGKNKGSIIEELENLNHLQSSICIIGLENVMSRSAAQKAKLDQKTRLTEIELLWQEAQSEDIAFPVLSALKPNKYLVKLKITGYGAEEFPDWLTHKDFMLQRLHLYKCQCKHLPALGQLEALKSLVLEGMSKLTQVDKAFCGQREGKTLAIKDCQSKNAVESFPSLDSLEFTDMAELQQWKELEPNDMRCLRKLRLIKCPKLRELPSLENHHLLKKLAIKDCQSVETLPGLPTSLNKLVVEDSDKLRTSCELGGVEYQKIQKIPNVIIDGVIVRGPNVHSTV